MSCFFQTYPWISLLIIRMRNIMCQKIEKETEAENRVLFSKACIHSTHIEVKRESISKLLMSKRINAMLIYLDKKIIYDNWQKIYKKTIELQMGLFRIFCYETPRMWYGKKLPFANGKYSSCLKCEKSLQIGLEYIFLISEKLD